MLDTTSLAAYILAKHSPMVTMKLHKLCYLADRACQVASGEQLIPDEPAKGPTGPVYDVLLASSRSTKGGQILARAGQFGLVPNPSTLEKNIIDGVLKSYEHMSGADMSAMFYATPELAESTISEEYLLRQKKSQTASKPQET